MEHYVTVIMPSVSTEHAQHSTANAIIGSEQTPAKGRRIATFTEMAPEKYMATAD
jgi:hypothetical protein